MTLTPDNALRQASMTAHDYAMRALTDLCAILGIEKYKGNWRAELAPFASVLAAMITAAAADYDTAARGGVIEGLGAASVDEEWEHKLDNMGFLNPNEARKMKGDNP